MPASTTERITGSLQRRTSRFLRRLVVRARVTLRAEAAFYFILFVLVGALGGLVGSAFRWLALAFQTVYFSSSGSLIEAARALPWYMKVLSPAGGAILAGLVLHYLLRGSGGGGVSEVMEAVALRARTLSMKTATLKSLSALFLMASGGSVGREGPIVTLSGAISSNLAHVLRLTPERRNILIGCGVAAGMAAVYNAPLGASLFVMEIVIANFAMDVFGPLVAASVMATLVSRALSEPGPIYAIPSFMPSSVTEYFILGLLGVPCALAGNLFTAMLDRGADLLRNLRLHPVAKIACGGLLVGAVGIWLPEVWGNGYDAVAATLNGALTLQILAAVFVGKMLATSLSLGSGGLGGVMTPTLLVGAALGGMAGHLFHALSPDLFSESGAYALAGMAGVLAATTRAPIMATFLTFELCQEYGMIVPLGVCAGISALVARRLKKSSIYAERLARKGLDLDAAIEESALQAIRVEDVLWTDPPTVPPDMPARGVMEKFLQSRRHILHVVDAEGNYHGLIATQDILAAAEDRNLDSILLAADLTRPMPSVAPEDPVSSIMERFWFQEFGELPVLKGTLPPRFVGVVTRRDILGAFDREVLRRRILTARYRTGSQRPASTVPLVGDYTIEEVLVPQALVGRTLAEISLPAAFRLTALALKRGPAAEQEEIIPPPPDQPLQDGDRLVLLGRMPDLARFARQ